MPSYSLSEIDALSRKASRGAGYSWGLAEDAGKAVRWLSAYGLPGASVLAELLQLVQLDLNSYVPQLKDRQCSNNNNQLCPIYSGAVINDQGHLFMENKALKFKSMLYPLLALPQAARISEAFLIPIEVSFGNAKLVCTRESLTILGEVDRTMKKSDITCKSAGTDSMNSTINEKLFPSPLSRNVDADVISILESFAHKTYAPATEASRLAGAGAGLSDND